MTVAMMIASLIRIQGFAQARHECQRAVDAGFLSRTHYCTSNNYAVCNPSDLAPLLRRGDSEAYTDGKLCSLS